MLKQLIPYPRLLLALLTVVAVTASASEPVAVEMQTVEATPTPVYVTLPGTVMSAERVQVASRLMGYVHELQVHEGQQVRRGQRLLLIDPIDIEGGIGRAEAGLAQARAALNDARRDYERFAALYREEAIPQAQYQKYKLAYDIAQSQYAAAQTALKTAKGQLRYAELSAPIDGVVVSKMTDNGQLASPGHPLLVIQGHRHLQVETQADARAYAHLQLGQTLPLEVDGPDFRHLRLEGRVERMVDAADPVTHTHLVKIALAEQAPVRSGAFARVFVPVGERPVIRVPVTALHTRAGIHGVFVVDAQDTSRFRRVRRGLTQDGRVAVLAGLVAGERIVVRTSGKLGNGTPVVVSGGAGE